MFVCCLTAAAPGFVSDAEGDLMLGVAGDLTALVLATAVEAHLLRHQIQRDLQERQRYYLLKTYGNM